MTSHFQSLREGIVTDPNQALAEMRLLTDAEKHQLLVEWNDTRIDYPRTSAFTNCLKRRSRKTPDAIAVVFADQQLTYRELNSRANQLAHYLRKLSVGPETLVGICMERSMEMIVGFLGILKAGGAYVPLDPTYPKERLAFMLEDSRAPFLLTQAQLGELRPAFGGTPITLDQDCQDIAQESTANVGPVRSPETLAYVIYTSGSTGKPKGVMIQHGSVVNFLASMARQPGLCETDTASRGHQLVLRYVRIRFLPAVNGRSPHGAGTPRRHCRWLKTEKSIIGQQRNRHAGDSCHMAHALSSWLARQPRIEDPLRRRGAFGGFGQQLGQHCASLWNMYGPTETTVSSSSDSTVGIRVGERPNRPPHRQHANLYSGSAIAAGPHWCAGRVVYRRRRLGPGLFKPS